MRPINTISLLLLMTFALAAWGEVDGIVVVRHAEKAPDAGNDPELSEAGRLRASALAHVLSGAQISALLSTHYQRTRQTLDPLAARHGLDIIEVPARPGEVEAHIGAVVDAIGQIQGGGIAVIAGHSNTVPGIVEALSGQQVAPLDETHYDRLYILIPGDDGMELLVTRFGQPDSPGD